MGQTDRKPEFKQRTRLLASELQELTRMVIAQITGRDEGLTVRMFGDRMVIDDPTPKPIAQYPYLFIITTEAADGIIKAKRVKIDGDAVGDEQVFYEYTG